MTPNPHSLLRKTYTEIRQKGRGRGLLIAREGRSRKRTGSDISPVRRTSNSSWLWQMGNMGPR